MPTPYMTDCPTRSPSLTPSTWSGSAPRSLTRSDGGLGRRGHKHDPLYKIRGLLRHGVEHLTEHQQAKISRCLDAGDPRDEVNIAWQCYQQLRSVYHATPATGHQIAIKVLDSF